MRRIRRERSVVTDSQPQKWIFEVSRAERTRAVAVRTLRCRLAAVLHYLPLAARNSGRKNESVHQLRVWTRRAAAALRLYRKWIPQRRGLWMKRHLAEIRRAAGAARDLDVLIERLRKSAPTPATRKWLKEARAERVQAQSAIGAIQKRMLVQKQLDRRVERLLDRTARGKDKRTSPDQAQFGSWARVQLRSSVRRFFVAVPPMHADDEALHRFRIAGKKLRYDMEHLVAAFPEEFRTQLYPVIEEFQDRLGSINDLVVAIHDLNRRIRSAGDSNESAEWRRMLAKEGAQLRQARTRFWEWCTPGLLSDWRTSCDRMIELPNGADSNQDDLLSREPTTARAGIAIFP